MRFLLFPFQVARQKNDSEKVEERAGSYRITKILIISSLSFINEVV